MAINPQNIRRQRRTQAAVDTDAGARVDPPTMSVAAQQIMPDIRTLQDERYAAMPVGQSEYAVEMDATWPLWSLCHKYGPLFKNSRENGWKRDYPAIQQLYVYSDLRLSDIAEMSGIALRTIDGASARYGWKESRRTHRLLQESAVKNVTEQLSTLEEAARNNAIRAMLTDAGMDLLRHAQAALARSTEHIEPRDIPALAQVALKLMGAGAKLPTDYRHSVVDNPNAGGGMTPTVNVLNITSQADADRLLIELSERAERLKAIEAKSTHEKSAS